MKKLYVKPEIEVFGFETEKMIAQSVPNPDDDDNVDMGWDEDGEEGSATNKMKHDWNSSPWK